MLFDAAKATDVADEQALFVLPAPAHLFGLEQEFEVFDGARQLDFRQHVHQSVRKTNRFACWQHQGAAFLKDGSLVTADGWEAEIACAPQRILPGMFSRLPALTNAMQQQMLHHAQNIDAPDGCRLLGYSTHFNVSCMSADLLRVSQVYARTFAPVMMLLCDFQSSPGLLVRARPNRFEVGTDFVPAGPMIANAAVYFVGSFLAALDAVVRNDVSELPFLLADDGLQPADERLGVYVDRRAFGDDLYERGRSAQLRLASGETVAAQTLMTACWHAVQPYLERYCTPEEIAGADAAIQGKTRIPLDAHPSHPVEVLGKPSVEIAPSEFARCLRSAEVGDTCVAPHRVCWDYIIYRLDNQAGVRFLSVPFAQLGAWLQALDGLRAASWIETVAHAHELATPEQAGCSPGLYRSLADEAFAADHHASELAADDGKKKKKKDDPKTCVVQIDDNGDINICMPNVSDPQQVLVTQEPPQNDDKVANGVWLCNGTFNHRTVDLRVPSLGMDFAFRRYYRSGIDYPGPVGYNWDHGYNIRVVAHAPVGAALTRSGWCEKYSAAGRSGTLTYYHGTGRVTEHAFKSWVRRKLKWCDANFEAIVTTYAQNDGEAFEIERYAVLSGTLPPCIEDPIFFRIRQRGGARVLLNCHGRLKEVRDVNHNKMHFDYTLPFDVRTQYFVLKTITDTLGRTYTLNYTPDPAPLLVDIVDPFQRIVVFNYDGLDQLEKVARVAGATGVAPEVAYGYAATQRPGLLDALSNPTETAQFGVPQGGAGLPWLRNVFELGTERVVAQQVGGTVGTSTAGGNYVMRYVTPQKVQVTDRVGGLREYGLAAQGGAYVVVREMVRDEVGTNGTVRQKNLVTKLEYDRHFHVIKKTWPSGRVESMRYRNTNLSVIVGDEKDDVINNISHYNDLGRDALMRRSLSPHGTGAAHTTTYDYEWLFGAVSRIVAPQGTTTFEYRRVRCAAAQYNRNPVKVTQPAQLQPDGTTLAVVAKYDYGKGGMLTKHTDPDGVITEWQLDGQGRVASQRVGGAVVEGFTHDNRGNVIGKTDGRGQSWSYSFDTRDLIVKETDPLGHVKGHTYNLNDWLTGTVSTRLDDPSPIARVRPQAVVNHFESTAYDILGQRIAQTELCVSGAQPATRWWRWSFDGEGRVTGIDTPRATSGERADARTTTQYNARGLPSRSVTAAGGTNPGRVLNYYTEDGDLALTVDQSGGRTVNRYDGYGRKVQESSGRTATHFEYRGVKLWREWVMGDVEARPNAVGGSAAKRVLKEERFEVDAYDRPVRRIVKVFDPRSRPAITDPAGRNWQELNWLTAAGRRARQVDPSNHVTRFRYDAQGRLDRVTLPKGHTLTYGYDGTLVASIATRLRPDPGIGGSPPQRAITLRTSTTYDALGRKIAETNMSGLAIRYAYDSFNNLRAQENPVRAGAVSLTQYEHDVFGRLVKQLTSPIATVGNPADTLTLRFGYDLNDNRIWLTDDSGGTTRLTFDGRDQNITYTEPGKLQVVITRRADGREVASVQGAVRTDIGYHADGQIRRMTVRGGGTTVEQRYGTDALGRAWWVSSGIASAPYRVITYRGYDSIGRVTSERTHIPHLNFDESVSYKHSAGQTTVGYTRLNSRVHLKHDADGNLTDLALTGEGTILRRKHLGPNRVAEETRGLKLSIAHPSPARVFNFKLRTSDRFDSQGRMVQRWLDLTDELHNPGQDMYLRYSTRTERVTYEASGQPFQRTYGVLGRPGIVIDATFVHDELGRLRTLSEGEGNDFITTDYGLDASGLLQQLDTQGRQGANAFASQMSVTYAPNLRTDSSGSGPNQRTTLWHHDAAGRLTRAVDSDPSRRRDFAYDAAGRLAQVDVDQSKKAKYLYDALNRVVVREYDGTNTYYLYNKDKPIIEFDHSRRPVRKYVYDHQQRLIHYGYKGAMGWEYFYPILRTDGSPWALFKAFSRVTHLDPSPGASATPAQRLNYYQRKVPLVEEEVRWRPFEKGVVFHHELLSGGNVIPRARAQSVMPVDSGGRLRFVEEDLFANGIRFYDANLRAFISPDPRGAWGHPLAYGNSHAYAANNPAAFGDDGNSPVHLAAGGVAIAMVLGAGTAMVVDATRQHIRMAEDYQAEFDWAEFWIATGFGAVAGVAVVVAPEAVIGLAIGGAIASTIGLAIGTHGPYTWLFDIATLGLPFAFKGSRAHILGNGSKMARGATASRADRLYRFEAMGRWGARKLGYEAPYPGRLSPAVKEQLKELGGAELERPLYEYEFKNTTRGEPINQQHNGSLRGENNRGVWMHATEEGQVVKLHIGDMAEGEITATHQLLVAVERRSADWGASKVRVARVSQAGRTIKGDSFLVKDFVQGSEIGANGWLESGGGRAIAAAMHARFPGTIPTLLNNMSRLPNGDLVIFDPW